MHQQFRKASRVLAVAFAAATIAAPAFADKPAWAGGGNGEGHKHEGHERHESRGHDEDRDGWRGRDEERGGARFDGRFGDHQRVAIREYFGSEMSSGRCPPGLAKKHNGCMPPGQAKKWARGRPLPSDVAVYDLPPSLVVQLGVPPTGYKYVRVASDVLMVALGTGMVVDAIEDLGRR